MSIGVHLSMAPSGALKVRGEKKTLLDINRGYHSVHSKAACESLD